MAMLRCAECGKVFFSNAQTSKCSSCGTSYFKPDKSSSGKTWILAVVTVVVLLLALVCFVMGLGVI